MKSDAFDMGRKAYLRGDGWSTCPFDGASVEYMQWMRGWDSAKQQLTAPTLAGKEGAE